MSNYTELLVWQKAKTLCLDIYRATEIFPDAERFGLVSQLRRASVSIVSNIAEGADRGTDKESKQFFLMSRGSLAELQTQLLIASDLGFISQRDYKVLLDQSIEVHKMINGLIKSLVKSLSLGARG